MRLTYAPIQIDMVAEVGGKQVFNHTFHLREPGAGREHDHILLWHLSHAGTTVRQSYAYQRVLL